MDLNRAQPPTGVEQATRCIILTTPGHEPDRDLCARLHQRRWEMVPVDDPHLAMAELCLEERLQASRSGWGLERARGLALLLDATRKNGADSHDRLVMAVQRYLPTATIWRYTDGVLSEVEPPAVIEPPADHRQRPHPSGAGEDDGDMFEASEVTSEEIEMLLSRDAEHEERHLP